MLFMSAESVINVIAETGSVDACCRARIDPAQNKGVGAGRRTLFYFSGS